MGNNSPKKDEVKTNQLATNLSLFYLKKIKLDNHNIAIYSPNF